MSFCSLRLKSAAVLIAFSMVWPAFGARPVRADEGMWTFDNPPLKQLKERYGFTPTKAWLDHVRLSSVRFDNGGSGSFVSPEGLVLTNHHVARDQLQKVSTDKKDYVKDGFFARTRAEELKSSDLELNILFSIEDVTARVQGSVKPDMDQKQALAAKGQEIARISQESLKATGLRSDVIPLYQGSEFWLYRYKRYTDVRLVFAPEQQIAYFGGDPDNFTYPRYDLDIALFRVYENDKPVDSKDYLKWSAAGAADGDLVFVSGNPGSTDRLLTMAEIEFERDHAYPATLTSIKKRLNVLDAYSARGSEQARQATALTFSLNNSLKALSGEYDGLLDKNLIAGRQKQEDEFRARVNQNPDLKREFGDAWDAIGAAESTLAGMVTQLRYRSLRRSFSSLADLALTVVRYVEQTSKPDVERMAGFHEAELEPVKFEMFSPAPVYPAMDELLIADSLKESLEQLGPDDPFIKVVLKGQSPEAAARSLIQGTKLGDPAVRKALVEGGKQAISASTDPLIVMARTIEPMLREMQKWNEDNVVSVETAAGEKIGKARFRVYGKSAYPDATFTLRLSYGTVRGYPMNGTEAPPTTTLYGLYDRAYGFGQKPPFDLPARYVERKSRLNLATAFDFVSTCDIIGGNSGSPVINRQGEFVGIIFDGNIESLVGRFVYDEQKNRAVSVGSAVILEALRKVYDAGALADELEGKPATSRR